MVSKLTGQLRREIEAMSAAISSYPREEQLRVCREVADQLVRQFEAPEPAKTKTRKRKTWDHERLVDTGFLRRNEHADISFDDYCEQRKPRSTKDRAVVCLHYLQTKQRMFPITFSHLLACFEARHWLIKPRNLQDCLYGLASDRGDWLLEDLGNGRNILLASEGKAYAETLPRRGRGRAR